MTGKNAKVLKKLKKSYAWSGMLVTLFLSLVMIVTLAILSSAALQYVLESWISAEYDRVSYMAHMYENGMSDELKRLDREDRAYVVYDGDEQVVYSYGRNTCSGTGRPVKVLNQGGLLDIIVFSDTESQLFAVDDDSITIDLSSFVPNLFRMNNLILVETPEEIRLPLWIGVKIKDGSVFAGRSTLDIDRNDLMFLGAVAGVLAGVFTLVFIFMLIRLIFGIRNRRRLTRLVFGDEVTGGNNWMYFRMKGEQILRRKRNAKNHYAVLDIVFYKYRNYCVCHSVAEGEKRLAAVRQIIENWLSRGELSAHYASANFAALIRADSSEILQRRLDALLGQLGSVDPVHNTCFHIGVACLDPCVDHKSAAHDCPIDLERDYNNACAARATLDETDGPAIAYFTDQMVEEQIWEDRVREKQMTALLNEEFIVYYQPKYNPADDKLRGAEALIRWQSPEYGFVSPGRIIPIFEKNGFITEIDHYMIRHVARDQKRWHDAGLNCVPVSVNVSRAHFVEEDLAEQIRDIVDSEGAPHELIELELTESAFFDDKKALVSTISKLKSYGFAVSMDDFGSGYSSLNSLKDLPLDVLKLDAEFFRGNSDGERSEIVISETIRLAQALNMRTVAEGVEVKEQVDFLAKQGCDMIQGYYYAKPMPGDEFEQRMNAG